MVKIHRFYVFILTLIRYYSIIILYVNNIRDECKYMLNIYYCNLQQKYSKKYIGVI